MLEKKLATTDLIIVIALFFTFHKLQGFLVAFSTFKILVKVKSIKTFTNPLWNRHTQPKTNIFSHAIPLTFKDKAKRIISLESNFKGKSKQDDKTETNLSKLFLVSICAFRSSHKAVAFWSEVLIWSKSTNFSSSRILSALRPRSSSDLISRTAFKESTSAVMLVSLFVVLRSRESPTTKIGSWILRDN